MTKPTLPAFLFALLLLLSASRPARADGPLTLGDYAARLDQVIDMVRRAALLAPGARQPLLDEAAASLLEVRQVQVEGGAAATVDNSALGFAVRSAVNDPAPALERLRALRAAVAAPPATAAAADRARMRDLLNRPPFVEGQSPFWEQARQQIADLLDRLLQEAGRGLVGQRDPVALAGGALAVVVILFLLWNLRKSGVSEAAVPGGDGDKAATSAAQAVGRAQQLATAGDYRSAVRELYLATLLLLDERGRLRFDHALTNREYLKAAGREPALAAALAPVVETFDRIWYGFERVSPQDFETYERQVEEVRKCVVI